MARERAEYERKLKAREKRLGKRKGKKPKPPDEAVSGDRQINLTDPDSALMRKSKGSEYRQSYNGQAAVSTDGSQLIVGARLSNAASDRRELVATVDAVPPALGRVGCVLADSGYANGSEVEVFERRSVEVLVAVSRPGRRRHDFRPEVPECAPPRHSKPWVARMKARLETARGRSKYQLRKQSVEPVFGILKEAMGFRRFLLRGLEKVQGEWQLVCLAYNCKRLHRLMQAMEGT